MGVVVAARKKASPSIESYSVSPRSRKNVRGSQHLLTPSPSFHKKSDSVAVSGNVRVGADSSDITAKSRGGGGFRSIRAFKPYGNVGLVKRVVITQITTMLRCMHYERFAQQTGGRTEVATRTIAIKSTQAGTDSRSLGRFVTALVCMAVMAKMGILLDAVFHVCSTALPNPKRIGMAVIPA